MSTPETTTETPEVNAPPSLIAELRRDYGPPTIPSCPVCGGPRDSIASAGMGQVTYCCSSPDADPMGKGERFEECMAHFSKSQYCTVASSDSRVLRVLDALDAALAELERAKDDVDKYKKGRQGAMHSSECWELMHAKRHEELENANKEIAQLRADLAAAREEMENAKCALGWHPDTNQSVADEISRIRDEGRGHFHHATKLLDKNAALTARAVEAESSLAASQRREGVLRDALEAMNLSDIEDDGTDDKWACCEISWGDLRAIRAALADCSVDVLMCDEGPLRSTQDTSAQDVIDRAEDRAALAAGSDGGSNQPNL